MRSKQDGYVSVVVGLVAALILLFLFTSFRVVGVGQVGLVTRFGKIVREEQSGIVIKAPWPIERLQKFDVRVQKEQADAQAATSDLQDVNTTLALNYHLDNKRVKDIYTQLGKDYKERVVDVALQEAFKATTAQFTAGELLTKRPEVKEKAFEALKLRLHKVHIIVDDISVINFKFSPEFTAAIEAKQVAAQQVEQAKLNADKAEQDAQAAVNAAKGKSESQRLVQETVTPLTLQKDAIEKWNGVLPTTVAGGSDTVFNVPLR